MTKTALFSVRKNEPCPQCGAELVIRSGKHGPFLGCSHYPDCDYVRPLKNQADGHIVKVLEGKRARLAAQCWYYARGVLVCLSVVAAIQIANILNLSISRMKPQLPAHSAGKGIWFSAAHVLEKTSIPAIVTPIASSS
ncbi:DNA topoisomerase type IA zn finger domain-containing protein [Klebsiella michiganensis]|uniref:DNA topoisomerase type IA zn finger domain-containing protein n=1 Tax=Klebsiella michiganensis TaxID=1134687 RepID=A0A7H4PGT8_9ENTR|nr:DNA topoisomerase type IA zn finger domain-containing protein [Klebsiella michiganensis]